VLPGRRLTVSSQVGARVDADRAAGDVPGLLRITSSMAAVQPMMRTEAGKTLGLLGYSAAKEALVNLMWIALTLIRCAARMLA
jgi:hypothetical protein